jgi:glycosyltransferase involved in cell wall biosynthesis
LKDVRAFSQRIRDQARAMAAKTDPARLRFGFVGNMANNLYSRAVPLRRRGLSITQFLHPQDDFIMSDPSWEEFDGSLEEGPLEVTALRERGVALPPVLGVVKAEQDPHHLEFVLAVARGSRALAERELGRRPYVDPLELLSFPSFFSILPTLDRLQEMDALLATQSLQIPLFAHRPYLAAQNGGDLWFEASRGDVLGTIQRRGFAAANGLLATNPWTFAHARRFGFSHAFYLPLMLDEEIYAPAAPRFRSEWTERSGGDFFVLVTARLDQETKGSQVALEGFRRFAPRCPGARLVAVTWGRDHARLLGRLREAGLAERLVPIPLSGKRRLLDVYRSADCLLDQFVLGQYGATALEAMACGLPVVMRLELAQYDALCETGAPPVLQAEGPEEVARHLSALSTDADARRFHRAAARTWFVANHSARRWADDYTALLVATALGHRFDFSDSPLRQPLDEEEVAYHTAGLASAPAFPEYRVG